MTTSDCQTKQAAWTERIADFKASGLSRAKWFAARGLKENQLSYWHRKLKANQPELNEIHWLPVDFSDLEPALNVKVGAASIEIKAGFDQDLFITVVKILSVL